MKIVSIGEVLWDIIGDKEYLGGAALNFAANAKMLGHDAYLVSAVGDDSRGEQILERMTRMGLSTRFVSCTKAYSTGVASVELDVEGQPHFRILRPAAYDFIDLTAADLKHLLSLAPDWIYFGTLHQMSQQAREMTGKLLTSSCGARIFYDINLRPACYEPQLVRALMSRATVVKLNDEEVPVVTQIFGRTPLTLEQFSREYARNLGWEAVCITRGAEGCALLIGGDFIEIPGYSVTVVDTVGAGDAFAAAFVHGLGQGWSPRRIGDFANQVGALVASRPGAVPLWSVAELAVFGNQHEHPLSPRE